MLNFTTYTTQLFNLVAAVSSDPNWNTDLPGIIDYAEQRIYRDLDLLATRVTDETAQASSGIRVMTLPTDIGTFLGIEGINVITPAGSLSSAGTRNQVTPVSRPALDAFWPSASSGSTASGILGVPEFFAWQDNANILFGPTPDQTYTVEVIGWQRPTVLSSNNSSTILTQMLPDLFMAASMVRASGFMRDFGSQADNPQMSQSWENQYQLLLKSADTEEARKYFRAQGWTSAQPRLVTTPPRI
jgi:hypothetical protein